MSFSRSTPPDDSFDRDAAAGSSSFRDELPARPIRNRPTAFGVWKFGIGKYSARDATRYAWSRVKASLLVAALLFSGKSAEATLTGNTVCNSSYDARTTRLDLCKPDVDREDTSTSWGAKLNNNFDRIDTQVTDMLSSVGASTASIASQFTAVGVSTTAIAASTTTLQASIDSKISTVTVDGTSIQGLGSASSPIAIVAGGVDTSKLGADSVITAKILTGAVTTPKIANSAVDTGKLATDSVASAAILAGAVTGTKIAANAVDTSKINTDAVGTTQLLGGSVTSGKLAPNAADTSKIAADAVGTSQLLGAAVTSGKLASSAVDTSKLAADAVGTSQILGGSVTSGKIASSAIDSSKLNSGLALPGGGSAAGPFTVSSTFTASLSAGIGGSPDSGLGVGVLQMKGPGTNSGGGKIRFGDAAASANPYCGEQGTGDSDALDCTGRLGFIMQNGASKGVGIYATSLTQLVSTAALTLVGSGLSVNNVTGNSSPAIEVSSGIVIANGCLTVGGGQICSPPSSTIAYSNLVSSGTRITATSGTNTTCGAAGGLAAVSSVTFTLAGTCNVQCFVDGNLSTTGSQADLRLCVLCDGTWPTDVYNYAFGPTTYAWHNQVTTAIDADEIVGVLKSFTLTSGAHTCALYAANSAGTWNFRNASIVPAWRCTCMGQ